MNKNVRVLYKKTGEVPQIKFITDMFEIKEMIVNGELDLAKYESCIIVCNSKEKRKNRIPNIVLDFKHIAGDFFLIGYDPKKKDFRSLEIDEAMFYIDSLQHKSFRHKEYEKWIKKQNTKTEHKEKETTFDFAEYQENQKEFAKKLNLKAEKNNSNRNSSAEVLEMILGIQAMILRYIKHKN